MSLFDAEYYKKHVIALDAIRAGAGFSEDDCPDCDGRGYYEVFGAPVCNVCHGEGLAPNKRQHED